MVAAVGGGVSARRKWLVSCTVAGRVRASTDRVGCDIRSSSFVDDERMTRTVALHVHRFGGLARTSDLVARGCTPYAIARAVKQGEVFRLQRGWVATPNALREAVVAVNQGGKLTGPTALWSMGIWDGTDRDLHVQLPVGHHQELRTSRTHLDVFTPSGYPREELRLHWHRERHPDPYSPPWRVSVIDALLQSSRILTGEHFVACVDSALNTRHLSESGLPILRDLLPRRQRALLELVDGAAESGLESLARQRLTPLVRDIRSQVPIAGIGIGGRDGRVDLLIDGWLVIELDGAAYHDLRANTLRDGVLNRSGRRALHFLYDQVMFGWPQVEETVFELLRYPPKAPRVLLTR